MTPGKVYGCSELRKVFSKKNFYIRKILKITKNKIAIRQKILFLFHRRENTERLSKKLKVEIEESLVWYILTR